MSATSDEDALVYENSFFRSLPLILGAERSPITQDLIQRGRQIAGHVGGVRAKENERMIQDILGFLKSVDDIQSAVRKGDWIALRETLAATDKSMFTRCDADKFRTDAQELVDFATVALPRFFASASEAGASGFADNEKVRAKAERTTAEARAALSLAELEDGDYLLGWNDVPGAYRYCHSFADSEIESLIADVANCALLVDRFKADGRTGDSNEYLVFRR